MPCHDHAKGEDRNLCKEMPHEFEPLLTHPNICGAFLRTANRRERGFTHDTQCGHTKAEHDKAKRELAQ